MCCEIITNRRGKVFTFPGSPRGDIYGKWRLAHRILRRIFSIMSRFLANFAAYNQKET